MNIFYTLDGTDPYLYFPLAKPYTGPVAITSSRTLKANAFRPGFGDSPRTTGVYTISAGRMATEASEAEVETPYSVQPNPFRQRFSVVRQAAQGPAVLTVFDGSGRRVSEVHTDADWTTWELDLSGQPAGLYVLHLLGQEGNRQVLRMVKE